MYTVYIYMVLANPTHTATAPAPAWVCCSHTQADS
jgi:hypothetical protein